nr:hypothetical protein [Tanacetum cinerariifolium]
MEAFNTTLDDTLELGYLEGKNREGLKNLFKLRSLAAKYEAKYLKLGGVVTSSPYPVRNAATLSSKGFFKTVKNLVGDRALCHTKILIPPLSTFLGHGFVSLVKEMLMVEEQTTEGGEASKVKRNKVDV